MKKQEQSYFFEKMDANGDGNLSLKELEVELEKYKIPVCSKKKSGSISFKRTMTITPNTEIDN